MSRRELERTTAQRVERRKVFPQPKFRKLEEGLSSPLSLQHLRMSSSSKERQPKPKMKRNPRLDKKRSEKLELQDLQEAVDNFVSPPSSLNSRPREQQGLLLKREGGLYDVLAQDRTDAELFTDLPLSSATQEGLKSAYFSKLTDIQAWTLPLALKGKDVLGAARTGSGKTLAFLVPVLEILLRKKWGPTDGLGALVISPTRELVSVQS